MYINKLIQEIAGNIYIYIYQNFKKKKHKKQSVSSYYINI